MSDSRWRESELDLLLVDVVGVRANGAGDDDDDKQCRYREMVSFSSMIDKATLPRWEGSVGRCERSNIKRRRTDGASTAYGRSLTAYGGHTLIIVFGCFFCCFSSVSLRILFLLLFVVIGGEIC